MPNLFDGYNKLSKEEIVTQVALLNTITMTNLMKPYGQKAVKGITSAVNSITSFFSNKKYIDEPKVKDINQVLADEIQRLGMFSRAQLDILLQEALCKRVNTVKGNISLEQLSSMVIDEAAKHKDYNIDESLTPAQKADSITTRFIEKLQAQMQKQNSIQIKAIEAKLDEDIQQLSLDKRRKLKNALQLEKLTGENVRRALMSMKVPALLLGGLTIGGFGSFLAVTTIIHAVFTTMLGITLPFVAYTTATSAVSIATGPVGVACMLGWGAFQLSKGAKDLNREVLSQSVACAGLSYGYFAPREEELPSWVSKEDLDKRNKIKEQDKLIQQLIKENKIATNNLHQAIDKIHLLSNESEQNKQALNNAQEQQRIAKNSLQIIQKDKENYLEQIAKLQKELAKASIANDKHAEVERLKISIATIQQELAKKEAEKLHYEDLFDTFANKENEYVDKIRSLEEERTVLYTNISELEQIKNNQREKLSRQQNKLAQEIKDRWDIYLNHMSYDKKFLKCVANFDYNVRLELEKVLKELNDSKDPRTLSRGKIKNTNIDHTSVLGNHYRLCWKISCDKKIELTYFGSHADADKYYQIV